MLPFREADYVVHTIFATSCESLISSNKKFKRWGESVEKGKINSVQQSEEENTN